MPKLIILVGPPGSGKSTYRSKLPMFAISQDERGREVHFQDFLYALDNKFDIVLDRMNFNKKQRFRYITEAKKYGYEIEAVIFHTPKALCLDRASRRIDHPTIKDSTTAEKVINFFFANYEKPEYLEGFSKISSRQPEIERRDAIVIDLDGTLCNIDHRLHWVKEKPKRWDKFFQEISNDKVNRWCEKLVRFCAGYETVYCSGRGEEYRGATKKWLVDHALWFGNLFMRPAGDYRPDDMIKETILDFDILPQYKPLFFVDDRKRVVDMWRRRGFTCLQCAPGDF